MLSKQLYLAGDQLQRMKILLKKTEDRLKSKDQEFNRLKKKVCGQLILLICIVKIADRLYDYKICLIIIVVDRMGNERKKPRTYFEKGVQA